MMKIEKTEITLIGAGGIGSNLLGSIAPAISTGPLVESLGGISLRVMDSDVVEARNLLMGQRFHHSDIGKKKVDAIRDSLAGFEGELMEVIPIPLDVTCSPNHIRNITPPNNVKTVVILKKIPGSVTAPALSKPTAKP